MLPALNDDGASPKETALADETRASEPLVGFRRPLVARGRDRGVTHHRVDRVVVGQRAVERDAGAERLDGLVARVGKGRRRLKADPRSAIAEGEVGRMVELAAGQPDRGPCPDRSPSSPSICAWARAGVKSMPVPLAPGARATAVMVNRFSVRGSANGHLVAHSETVHAADLDIGRAGARIRERAWCGSPACRRS